MITGSVAVIFHGAPRMTHDVDLILDIQADKAESFSALFPINEFYCPPVEVLITEMNRSVYPHFNLIHHKSGFKADIYPSRDWLQKWGMEHRRLFKLGEFGVWVAPPEYVIIKKLEYFSEGGSTKHLTDIQSMLPLVGDGFDLPWLLKRIAERGLEAPWNRVQPPNV